MSAELYFFSGSSKGESTCSSFQRPSTLLGLLLFCNSKPVRLVELFSNLCSDHLITSSTYNNPCDHTGLTWVIQGTILISMSWTLITFAKLLLVFKVTHSQVLGINWGVAITLWAIIHPSSMATITLWQLSTWNMASAAFYFVLVNLNLNLNTHMWTRRQWLPSWI